MSATSDSSNDSSTGIKQSRQPAVPVLASVVSAARRERKEREGERAPKFAVLPTGTQLHRVIVSGVLTNIDLKEGDSTDYAEVHITDASGTTVYCYPTEAHSDGVYETFKHIAESEDYEVPAWVTVVGKPSPFKSNNGGDWLVSLDIEKVSLSEKPVVQEHYQEAAQTTVDMVETFLDSSGEAEAYADKEYTNRTAKVAGLLQSAADVLEASSDGLSIDLPDIEAGGDSEADTESQADATGEGGDAEAAA